VFFECTKSKHVHTQKKKKLINDSKLIIIWDCDISVHVVLTIDHTSVIYLKRPIKQEIDNGDWSKLPTENTQILKLMMSFVWGE
jgi:hypothetical protein